MLLSDLLRSMCADSLGDVETLMKAAEGLEVCVHIKSPIPIEQLSTSIAIINKETNWLKSLTVVFPRDSAPVNAQGRTQGEYWQKNHNPWLD